MSNLWNVLLRRWRFRMQAREPDADFVMHRPRRRRRIFCFPEQRKQRRLAARIGFCLCAAVFLISGVCLATYAVSYIGSRLASDAMRSVYYDDQPSLTAAATATVRPDPTRPPSITAAPTAVPSFAPAATASAKLKTVRYPSNPYNIINARFEKLRRQNKDIIGWLTIEDLLDEAVVQRDNEYYLDRDYLGYHNANGAIFLDQYCDLTTRPYTCLVYGHNMRSGLMFGSLRNYEDITFYRNNPVITFDTLYEEGRYVIFAVATISTDPLDWRFLNFTSLCSPVIAERQGALNTLFQRSRYTRAIDVQPEDQLLLLITCASNDTERRVIAARRIRDDETESDLRQQVRRTLIR